MDKSDVLSLVKHIDFLDAHVGFFIRRKFGKRATDPREVEAYRKELCALPPEKLQALYEKEEEQERVEQQAAADRLEAQWFFHQPGTEADFEHWSKTPYWTLDEAIALSFGKAPEIVRWEEVEGLVSISPFAAQYARVRDLALRAIRYQQLDDPVFPGIFLGWAKRNDIEYPAELETQVVARGQQIADWKSLHDGLQAQFTEIKKVHDAYVAWAQARPDDEKRRLDGLAAERDALLRN